MSTKYFTEAHERYRRTIAERNDIIHKEYSAGAKIAQLAHKYNLSDCRIRQIVKLPERKLRYQQIIKELKQAHEHRDRPH